MTNEEAKKIIKSECYIADLLNLDRTQMVNTALDIAVKALEQQPSEDCISRKDLLKRFKKECATDCSCCLYARDNDEIVEFGYREWCGLIEDAPSVTPRNNLAETSQDCISREAAIACCRNEWEEEVAERLNDLPSLTPTYDLEEYSTKLWKLAHERGKAEGEQRNG